MRTMHALLLGACIALGGCASVGNTSPLVATGAQRAGKLTIQSEMEWTRAAGSRYQMWTIDGELLNLLYLVPTVKEGEYIFLGQRESKRRPDGPYYHHGLREDEIRDLISDGLASAGFIGIQATNLRPATFGGRAGLRFEVTMANPDGLAYQGLVAAFEHDEGLTLAIFIAPREYYFPRDGEKVSRMLDTMHWE
ncbi:hypothetical protein LVB87_07840 [Lysobacter sp. KIS68-7]|uniref:hypothetical protein n=1 Tax=Lysobacter sp. KIS68-7 TaxID=2904252 RepID=UPI001E5A24F8|nr:hypothetical protein [Lysobacter sp. KIS68-7]UHQ18144.1 hypothetical protein LVB87_07840 [Lysobacter sp. KIS68-7]